MMARLTQGVPRRGWIFLAALLIALIVAPRFVNDYLLTVLILILYFAYTGQAWNIMMGFAGQLSLGHAIYVGLGAYTAAALYVHFGVGPWIGLIAAVPVAMACGAIIGFLAFRFGVAGVYFAILTIAFAEFARIGFDHIRYTGGSAGFFLPVAQYATNDLWNLRGKPVMFYYVILALTVAAFALCHVLLRSRIGYFWLAIREDEEAARALGIDTFRYKMVRRGDLGRHDGCRGRVLRVLLQQPVPRAGLSHLALDRAHSGADHRRHRHAVRSDPRRVSAHRIVGSRHRGAARARLRFSRCQAGILRHLPADRGGRAARRHLAVAGASPRPGAAAMSAFFSITGVSKRFRGLLAVDRVSCEVERGEIFAVIGPNGAGKTTLFNMIAGALRPDEGEIAFQGERIEGLRPDEVCRRGIARTFQIVRPFPMLTVEDNVMVGALLRTADVARASEQTHEVMRRLDLFDKRARVARSLTLPDRKRLEVARALATSPQMLLLDEVMAGLRPTETDRIVAILRELNAQGLTILLIEHVMRAVMALANRVLVLHHGAQIALGKPEAVTREPAVVESYLGVEAL